MSSRRRLASDRRAVEPVIATVILLAVTLSLTFAFSNLLVALPSTLAHFEKCEIIAVQVSTVPNGWLVTVEMKNSGSADGYIDSLSINGKPVEALGLSTDPDLEDTSYRLGAGCMGSVQLIIPVGTPGCSSGSTIDIALHVESGASIMQMVSLT